MVNKLFSYTVAFIYQAGYTLLCTVVPLPGYTLLCTVVPLPGYTLLCTVVQGPKSSLLIHYGPVPQSAIFIGSLTNENPFTVTIANTNNVKVRFHRTE